MIGTIGRFRVLFCWTLTLSIAHGLTPSSRAQPPQRFSQAELFFELNDTDGDLGIHAAIDGGGWTELEVDDPGDQLLLEISSRGQLRNQTLTQLSFESAEPPFDELDPAEFFRRFPEGQYTIEGRAADGTRIQSVATLSHVLAAPPENILISGVPAAENCDAKPLPRAGTPVVIRWDPVSTSHPEIGKTGPITVSMYQLFVEGPTIKFSVDLPPTVTEFEVPTGVTLLDKQFKFEIIVRTATGNNTAVESCFRL